MSLARDPAFFDLLTGSYVRAVGAEPPFLPDDAPRGAEWLYEHAAHCVLAHNTDPDPRFIYANKAAQACFEYSFEEIVGLPSRLSAEAPDRAERQRLLEAVARDGYAANYRGWRIAKSGRRFFIEDGVVWQLIDADGTMRVKPRLLGAGATPEHQCLAGPPGLPPCACRLWAFRRRHRSRRFCISSQAIYTQIAVSAAAPPTMSIDGYSLGCAIRAQTTGAPKGGESRRNLRRHRPSPKA